MSEVTMMEELQGIANCCECEATENRLNGWIKKASAAPEQEAVGRIERWHTGWREARCASEIGGHVGVELNERGESLPEGTPLYTHADDGEIERLLAELEAESKGADRAAEAMLHWKKEADSLRQKLAEAQALLRAFYPGCGLTKRKTAELRKQAAAFLSATAQPSESTDLYRFLDAAAGEGLICGDVDAEDLFFRLYPDAYERMAAQPAEVKS